MNNSSFLKISLVAAMVVVALGASAPQKVLAQETGTVPIIKTGSSTSISHVRDNTTVPIVADPSTSDVTAPPGGTPDNPTFTVTVTVNAPVTEDTKIDLDTNEGDAINLPGHLKLHPGDSAGTITVGVVPGYGLPHKHVKIYASCNGTAVEADVTVHYHGGD